MRTGSRGTRPAASLAALCLAALAASRGAAQGPPAKAAPAGEAPPPVLRLRIAEADQQIAQLEREKGIRELASGVEQLYWGLLAARRIRAGAAEGQRGAEALARTGLLEAKTALLEARQALQMVDKQIADLQE